MTLLQMAYVLEIYNRGSMNKAAQALFISQSTISSAIAELEDELGIRIFNRSKRGVVPTDEGKELLAQITPVVERYRDIVNYYGDKRNAGSVSLSIASQRFPFCTKAFVELMQRLDCQRMDVSMKEMEMRSVIDEVASQQSGIGIIFVSDLTEIYIRRILESKNLEFHPLVKVKPHVFVRKGHPLTKYESVSFEQLRDYPYIVYTQQDSNINFAEEVAVGTGQKFDRLIHISDRATFYSITAHTDCVSTGSGVLPIGFSDERLAAIPLEGSVDTMTLGYIKIKGLPISEYGELFIEILRNITSQFGSGN